MNKLLIPLLFLPLLAGCSGIPSTVKAMAKDPSTLYMKYVHPVYGALEVLRVGSTNTSVSISEGKIGVNPK